MMRECDDDHAKTGQKSEKRNEHHMAPSQREGGGNERHMGTCKHRDQSDDGHIKRFKETLCSRRRSPDAQQFEFNLWSFIAEREYVQGGFIQ